MSADRASNLLARIGAVVVFTGIALGAFGAHLLAETLAERGSEATWNTAVLYQLVHGVVLYFLARQTVFSCVAWGCLFAGILLFSGSLYLLALTDMRWPGPITPLGGLSFLFGWLWLAIKA